MIALKITIEKLKYARSSSIIEIFKDKIIIDTLKYWLFENCIVSNFYLVLDFGLFVSMILGILIINIRKLF